MNSLIQHIEALKSILEGDILIDKASKIRYATDASVYYELPQAIIIPKHIKDIEYIVCYAAKHKLPLIPRAAGTSLAGQVVGNAIVVDISKYINNIIEINRDENWVRVEPGVILDELNSFLAAHGLFFGPEASTSNRCMLGGMVGNNACGLHAVVYGTTRDHILEATGFLSDGSQVTFKPLLKSDFNLKCELESLEGDIYRNIRKILSDENNRKEIIKNYPEPRLVRRNNGYALDQLMDTDPFTGNGKPLNLSKLIAGSEGTLLFITNLKLNLVDLPPLEKGLVCAHFNSVYDALKANIVALKHGASAVELMDDIILNASKNNIDQEKNRFFVQGNPKAILMIEFWADSRLEIDERAKLMIKELEDKKLGYYYPLLYKNLISMAWNLRKAGLGIMANIPGDKKSVTVIEDTAVHTDVLPEYIDEFSKIMELYGEECVYHAHAGTGEIHLRPRLDLKQPADIDKFEKLAWDIAHLVKKYKGSLSGEHGDGRLRGQFIPFMLGETVYSLLKELKNLWDPNHIFNPGKIIDTPPMRNNLRYKLGETREIETIFDFSEKLGIVRATESCNGSGDCRKLQTSGGTMCPSYMVTHDEQHSTRGRANILREFLTSSPKTNPFNHQEIYDALDLCLSCKACKSECPSSVDVAKLKAEFLQHWYDANGIPLRIKVIANINKINRLGSVLPGVYNFIIRNEFTSGILKRSLGFSKERQLPLLQKITLRDWTKNRNRFSENRPVKKSVVLFVDEFTNYNDTHIGITAIRLLTRLGYVVEIVEHAESGRTYLSKGLIREAKKIANSNIIRLKDIISENKKLIGIEPSAILTFRDEYPDLVDSELKEASKALSKNCLLIDEFLALEYDANNINRDLFVDEHKEVLLHGHCQQKALSSTKYTLKMLSLPLNYIAKEIPSGCCGMAGSFGFEKEHYKISMEIGELVLFPTVRKAKMETIIVAPGTSCRHQINDGTGRQALHPVQVLFGALKDELPLKK